MRIDYDKYWIIWDENLQEWIFKWKLEDEK
ncbi:hypothetical protein LCGC14_2172990 [marine sediment metagenome]|uniref:Uncharacterized protein n=1 Tax=marine sediment metagenome TaxID=412755 RepID=A0A0F9DPK2_9ZZZZ